MTGEFEDSRGVLGMKQMREEEDNEAVRAESLTESLTRCAGTGSPASASRADVQRLPYIRFAVLCGAYDKEALFVQRDKGHGGY
jgi:hypothetical protein